MTVDRYHHGDLRAALIREAVSIIGAEGRGGLTLRKIARRVGVSHAAPYRHFASLDGLMSQVAEAGLDRLAVRLSASADAPTTKRIEAMVLAYVAFAHQNEDWFQIMFDHAQGGEVLLPAFEVAVQAAQDAGQLRTGEGVAAAIWTCAHGMATLRRADIHTTLAAVMRGLRP